MRWIMPLALAAITAGSAALAETGAPTWTLLSVGDIPAEGEAFIGFSEHGVFGSTGCNRFSGGIESAPGSLMFSEAMAVTRMACHEPLNAQEQAVLSALRGTVAVAYDPVAEKMELRPEGEAPVLVFARAVAENVETCALETGN